MSAIYWHVRDERLDDGKAMLRYAYDRLNDELDLSVEFKGWIKVGKDMRIK